MTIPADQPANIILVGFMATGKTHVGRCLSQLTGWPLRDADDEIVRRAGCSIDEIFARDGEAAFRTLEHQVIADLCSGKNQVISAGGGAFVQPANRDVMLRSGLVFCLTAAPENIYARIQKEADPNTPIRPLLAGGDPLQRIRDLLETRAEAYSHAHHTIPTDTLSVEQVADRVLTLWRESDASPILKPTNG